MPILIGCAIVVILLSLYVEVFPLAALIFGGDRETRRGAVVTMVLGDSRYPGRCVPGSYIRVDSFSALVKQRGFFFSNGEIGRVQELAGLSSD